MSTPERNLGYVFEHKDENHKTTGSQEIESATNDSPSVRDLGGRSKRFIQHRVIGTTSTTTPVIDSRSASDSSDEIEIDYSEQSYADTEYFYQSTDDEEDLESEDQSVDSCCLIAIGVLDDDSSDEHEGHKNQHRPQPSGDPMPPSPNASDEAVAKIIAREEHDIKKRIKKEREEMGRLRPAAPRTRTDTSDTAEDRCASATRADQKREEKMRTFEARHRGAVPRMQTRTQPLRDGGGRPRAEARRLGSGSVSLQAVSSRPPIQRPSRQRDHGTSSNGEDRLESGENDKRKWRSKAVGVKPPPPISYAERANLEPMESPRPLSWNSTNDEAIESPSRSQRSVSSGIDLDEKTRQRILSRSNLRRAKPRRPIGSSPGSRNEDGGGASALSLGTGRKRPSDDKRNLRISPKMMPSSLVAGSNITYSNTNTNNKSSTSTQQLPSSALATPGTARAGRPSDEKAAFRRRRHPPPSSTSTSTSMIDKSPIATDAIEPPVNGPDEENPDDIGSDESVLDDSLDSVNPRIVSHNDDDDFEYHRHHHSQEQEDNLEAGAIDEEEPEILPGAFAVSGIGDDDEEGQGVSGYDSGFEDNTDSLLETMYSDTEDANDFGGPEESQQPIDGNGDQESPGTGDAMMDSSAAAAISDTPLQAELYEIETAVDAVTAKVLIVEEDPNLPGKIRKLSVQMSCVLVVVFIVAGITMGVVLPRVVGQNNFGIDAKNTDQDGVPVVKGWRPVGDVLTAHDVYKDNIRFGNAVAISADGNRIAVGLPGSDNPGDDSLKSTGSVKIFDLVDGTEWEPKFQTFGMYSNAELGTSVALSNDGKRVAIGAPSYDSDETGYVSIYEESNATRLWELVGTISSGSNTTQGGIFGDAVGFSGDGKVIAIGDKYSDVLDLEDNGAVNVYQETNGTWNQIGNSLLGSNKRDLFGWSVALSKDGNRVAASSLGSNEKPGNVKIFDFNGTAWEGAGSSLVGESTRELFGVSVEFSGDGSVIASSATGYSRDGQEASVGIVRSYRYDRKNEEWSLYGQPLEGGNEFDAFGSSIALSYDGDTVAIGAPGNGDFCDDCGHIEVFRNVEGTWNSSGSALGKSGIDSGQFGYAVALSATGNRLVGAAPFTTFNGFVSKVGQVLVFDSLVEDSDN